MSRGKRLALGGLLVAALTALPLLVRPVTPVPARPKAARADAEEVEKAATDCHEQDVLLEGSFRYRLRKDGKGGFSRVEVLGAETPLTVSPASVSITEPIEDEPEYISYDGCERRVQIVVKNKATAVTYE